MLGFSLFFFWFGFSIVVGVAANTRGRTGFGWFLLAIVISPLLAGLLVLALPRGHAGSGSQVPLGPVRSISSKPLIKAAGASPPPSFDREKWEALLRYDDDIAAVAKKLRPLGDKAVDEFAHAYLALNDKSYLPSIVKKIIVDARAEAERNEVERGAFVVAQGSYRSRNWKRYSNNVVEGEIASGEYRKFESYDAFKSYIDFIG